MDVLALLRSKNRCLERFLALSIDYLERDISRGDFSGLSAFEDRRDATLRAMNLYDRKITEAVGFLTENERDRSLVLEVRQELSRKEQIVRLILEADLKIISRLEAEKNTILQEMSTNRKGITKLAKFKSEWLPRSGDGLDETL